MGFNSGFKGLKVLKCYNFLWVQRRHNCSPAASFANCVMTLHLLKVHLSSFYTNSSKMPNFELCHSCRKWAICNLCPEHGSSTLLRESSIRLPDCTACQKTTTDICNAVSFPDFTYKILFWGGFGWNQNFWSLAIDSVSLMLRVDVSV